MAAQNPKPKQKKSHIPFRLNMFFLLIVCLFGGLVIKLVDLQVVHYDDYARLLTKTTAVQVKKDMARGQIFDKDGNLLVGNVSHTTINYTRDTVDATQLVEKARGLSTLITLNSDFLRERDYQDYFVAANTDLINERLSAQERRLTGSQLNEAQLSKVTAEDIATISESDKEVVAIFTRMNSAKLLETVSVKNRDVTDQEVASVTDNLVQLGTVSIGSDWERTYPQGDFLRPLLGSLSTQTTGLPAESANSYLAQGYANNSRVGTSYIEQYYDSVLKGSPQVTNYVLDRNQTVVSSQISYEGKAGGNVYLTIDSDLQRSVESALTGFLQQYIAIRGANSGIYAVIQDAKTGGILAMSGKKYGYNSETNWYTDEIEDDILGVINNNYVMGSAIKAATVGIGYKYGAITEDNNEYLDHTLSIPNFAVISSSFNNYGGFVIPLNDVMALARSSNIYMMRIAMALGGTPNYENGTDVNLQSDTLTTMRKEYAQYGLGGNTGIDLPTSSTGYSPTSIANNSLFLSFGQFDAYSTLQLSQYMMTVANNGVRYAPRVVGQVRDINTIDSLGKVQIDKTSTIMNDVGLSQSQMDRIKEGLFQVTHHPLGTEYSNFVSYYPQVSGKTGTAEAKYNGPVQADDLYTVNSTFTGYSPSDNPEVIVTVVIPNLASGYPNYAGMLSRQLFSLYYAHRD